MKSPKNILYRINGFIVFCLSFIGMAHFTDAQQPVSETSTEGYYSGRAVLPETNKQISLLFYHKDGKVTGFWSDPPNPEASKGMGSPGACFKGKMQGNKIINERVDQIFRSTDSNLILRNENDLPVRQIYRQIVQTYSQFNGVVGGLMRLNQYVDGCVTYFEQQPVTKPDCSIKCLTVYLGGAGMDGSYIQDQIVALKDNCLGDVVAGKYTSGMSNDAYNSVRKYRRQVSDDWTLQKIGVNKKIPDGGKFNLIGYSWGSLIAAQTALHYASKGVTVDNLFLIGSPISREMLIQTQTNRNIKNVHILDLTDRGDKIYAGMRDPDLVSLLTADFWKQFGIIADFAKGNGSGHFYYSPNGAEGNKRRRELAKLIKERFGDCP